jgi:predicted ATPase
LSFENLDGILDYTLGYYDFLYLPETFEEIDRDLNFVSSFRLEPERTYYQKTKADEKTGRSGQGYIDQILEWENHKAKEFKILKSVLKNLGLLRSLKIQQLLGGRFEISVKVKPNGIWASLADVGFGISQFLPVVVADLQLSNRSILLLAQPEIHLHPSVQASLLDYFVKQIKNTNKQYIIETHSEYLLNRIRLSIVKGEIEPSDVSAYYFESSIEGSITHKIEFTRDGQIQNAPQGFFDTYMIDTMDIALYA